MKKWISCILVMVMTISIFGTLPANAENGSLEPNSQMETDISVQGTNSFGNLLTNELTAEMDKQEENNGCNIFSIDMNGTDATVSFETTEDCTLVIAVYDESGEQMLASGNTAVVKGETEVLVTIDTDSMPQYYYLRGFLVDSDTLRPVCTVYESPNYTQEMQAFFAKTVNDFDSEKVLNLDESESNNFAVFSNETIIIEQNGTTNRVTKADDSTRTYVIANADNTVKSLKNGNVFTCKNGDETLIVKVDNISVSGSTVTISGQDTSMEEVFDYVKIDTSKSELNNARVYQQKSKLLRAAEFEGNMSATAFETSFLPAVDGLSGTLKMTVSASLKLYLSKKYQYVEMKMGYKVKLAVALEQKKTISLPLPEMNIPTPVGVNISVTPSLDLSVGGKVEISGTLSGQIGFAYDSDEGKVQNITSAPTFDSALKLEVEVSIVLSLKPNVNFIDDKIVSIYLEGKIGIYATAEKILWQLKKDDNIRHECRLCFDGETNFKANTGFGVEAFGINVLDRGMFEQSHKLNDFYYSVDRDEYGLGSCPHQQYRVNVRAVDASNNPIGEVSIIRNDPIGDIFLGETDSNGNLEIWLSNGDYTLTAKKENVKNTRDITVGDRGKSVMMALNTATDIIDYEKIYYNFIENELVPKYGLSSLKNLDIDYTIPPNYNDWYGIISADICNINGNYNLLIVTLKEIDSTPHLILELYRYDGSVVLMDSHDEQMSTDTIAFNAGWNGEFFNISWYHHFNYISSTYGSYNTAFAIENSSFIPKFSLNYSHFMGGGTIISNSISEKTYFQTADGSPDGLSEGIKMIKDDLSLLGISNYEFNCEDDPGSFSYNINFTKEICDFSIYEENGQPKDYTNLRSHITIKTANGISSWANEQIINSINAYLKENWCGENRYYCFEEDLIDNNDYFWIGIRWDGSNSANALCGSDIKINKTTGEAEICFLNKPYEWFNLKEYDNEISKSSTLQLNDNLALPNSYASPLNLTQSPTLLADEEYGIPIIWGATSSYWGLNPNEIYNFYVMKSETAESPLSSDNLLYIAQAVSDANGNLEIPYTAKEQYENAVTLVKAASKTDLSSAQVTIPDILCNGAEQFAEPEVTLNEETLTEGMDYDIEKRYSAIYPGEYELIITGIRNYTGEVSATYNIYCEHNFADNKCTICKSFKDTVGDANGDGVVGIADLVVLQSFLLAKRNDISINADINQDGVINGLDLCMLRRIILNALN